MLLVFLKRLLPFKALFPEVFFSPHNQRKKERDGRVHEVGKGWTGPARTGTLSFSEWGWSVPGEGVQDQPAKPERYLTLLSVVWTSVVLF